MNQSSPVFRVTLATPDVERFLAACAGSEWYAFDTGERIMTEEGPDAEAVLLVEPVATATASSKAATLVAQ